MARGHGTHQRYADQLRTVTIGQLAGADILTTGEIFYVKDPDDANANAFRDVVPLTHRFTTLALALAEVTDDANDYVLLAPKDRASGVESPWTPGADVAVNASRCHLVGVGGYGSRPQILLNGDYSVVLGGGNLVTNQLHGIELANLTIVGSGAAVQSLVDIGVAANGYVFGSWIHDCEIGFSGATLTAADAEILDHGSEALFERCEIGLRNTAEHPDDNYLQVAPTAPAAEVHNVTFKDCTFHHFAAAAGDQFATILATNKPALFHNCQFINSNVSAQAMTTGIIVAAAAEVLFHNCAAVGATTLATTANSWVVPGGIGLAVTSADVFNPALGIDGAEPVAVDT